MDLIVNVIVQALRDTFQAVQAVENTLQSDYALCGPSK